MYLLWLSLRFGVELLFQQFGKEREKQKTEMNSKFHAFMYPWFAFGHMTPYLHLANKLAEKGNRITFLLPKKCQKQLEHLNLFPQNIVFHPLTIPHVDGLPPGAETASDIPVSLGKFLTQAMDLTRDQVEAAVLALKPDLILFDFAYWVPEMARAYEVKSVCHHVVSASSIAYSLVPDAEPGVPPPGYPSSKVTFRKQDAYSLSPTASSAFKRIINRIITGLKNCDVISLRTCQDIEGSQINLEKDQFQELCLGMELTGLPFLVAVKPPKDAKTIQEALPEGFEERVKGRGVVWGGWVQQPLLLAHPSIGCFVSHCGFGSMWESLVSDCQIVLLPYLADQVLNTRLMTEELEVSVEVQREETGWFTKENLSYAIMSVMNKESELGNNVRGNRVKWKDSLFKSGLMNGHVDKYVEALVNLVHKM
ncbi:hypothetical protein Bca52824_004267 [Brassica carinata]|uniref:Glycosyltransferase n=1 Tax=Brassica carinata TaxID=52824 RepID=A0A8X8BGJ7_BRACI|nr:hypothetical protein Bca52824_004267 [Brassica carinata]